MFPIIVFNLTVPEKLIYTACKTQTDKISHSTKYPSEQVIETKTIHAQCQRPEHPTDPTEVKHTIPFTVLARSFKYPKQTTMLLEIKF